MRLIFSLIIFSFVLFSCSKETTESNLSQTSDYYPMKIGSWHIYDVDSITYNDFTEPVTIDTFTYQVMEELTDTFYDLEGSLSYEITRSKRSGNDSVNVESQPWEIADIWWVKNSSGNIERIEENIRYVSLLNPIREGKSWDGNVFNYMDAWDFTYENVGKSFEDYDNTITVNQKFEDVVIIYRDYNEVFAKGIGLVSRTRIDVESQDISNPLPILSKGEKGFQFFQTLNSYYIPE